MGRLGVIAVFHPLGFRQVGGERERMVARVWLLCSHIDVLTMYCLQNMSDGWETSSRREKEWKVSNARATNDNWQACEWEACKLSSSESLHQSVRALYQHFSQGISKYCGIPSVFQQTSRWETICINQQATKWAGKLAQSGCTSTQGAFPSGNQFGAKVSQRRRR